MKAFEYLKDLPSNWCLIPLGDVVRTQSCDSKLIKGKLPKSPGAGLFPAFSASGQDVWAPKANHKGDAVIVSAVGARCGKCFRATGKWSAIANTHIVWPDANVLDADFLWRAINNENFWIRGQSAQPYVQVSASKSKLIPLPPPPEQKKIAHILSTVQRAIEAQERIIQTTTELFKVMLHKLMTAQIRVSDGRGVKEYFRETRSMSDSNLLVDPLPSGWKNFQFGEVCDRVKDSHSPVEGGKTPYVGLEHLAQGFPAFVGRGTESDVKSSKTAFKIGDILFGKLRPYLRKGAQADFDGISSTDILVFRVEDRCASDFLKYLVHSDEFIDYAKSTTSGVQHPRTSWPSLKEFHLSLPPLPEQKKIAHTLSVIQKRIDVAQTKKIKLEDLFRTLLHELMTAKIRINNTDISKLN